MRTHLTDGDTPASALLSDGSATYVPGVSERRNGTSSFFLFDVLGSVRAVSGAAGAAGEFALFEAFGNAVTTADFGGSTTAGRPFGFVGSEQYQADAESGLLLLGNRYYDPGIGRFLSSDPAEDGDNFYAYCENNPVNAIDPEGLCIMSIAAEWPTIDKMLNNPNYPIADRADRTIHDRPGYRKRHPGHTGGYVSSDGTTKTAPLTTDCGTFVGDVMGPFDPNFPKSGATAQLDYMRNHPGLYEVGPVNSKYHPTPGDVVARPRPKHPKPGQSHQGHIGVVTANGSTGEASLGGHDPDYRKWQPKRWPYYGRRRPR